MKRKILTLAAVVLGLAVLAPAVRADPREPSWGVTFGVGFGCGHLGGFVGDWGRGHRPHRFVRSGVIVAPAPVHVHQRVAFYRPVWIPARFEQVFVGYDFCGNPVYQTVCVVPGHYEQVIAGYRCSGCGSAF